MIIFARSL